jgi:hypothetical protein
MRAHLWVHGFLFSEDFHDIPRSRFRFCGPTLFQGYSGETEAIPRRPVRLAQLCVNCKRLFLFRSRFGDLRLFDE